MSSQLHRRRLELEDMGEVTVAKFTDRKILEEQTIQVIGEQLFRVVDELGRKKLLLNFGNVQYLSSTRIDADSWWASFKQTPGEDAEKNSTAVAAGVRTAAHPARKNE
jgi:hypothetical protein